MTAQAGTARITGIVLAAGGSRRLGTPKQILPYGDTTVLGATLDVARAVGFDQLILTLGGAVEAVRDHVSLDGAEVVVVENFGTGCSASLRIALQHVDPKAAGLVLMLGDQPRVDPSTVRRLIAEGPPGDVMVCRYNDGIGHPFWLSRNLFGELQLLHGDKSVWKLVESGRYEVRELVVNAPIPLDVDTWDDYQRLVGSL